MTVTMKQYGTLHQEALYEFTLVNHNGMTVHLLNYGATLSRVVVQTPKGPLDQILTLDGPEAYSAERNFLGGTVGRFAGRVLGHIWQHGDQNDALPPGEGDNAIHGGPVGLDMMVFTPSYREAFDHDTVTFTVVDYAGHNQLPGNVQVVVTYTLDDDDRLTYHVQAVSDAMTLFNPTNHVYFAVDGPDQTVADNQLELASDYYAPLGANHLPTPGWVPVAGTPFDLRTPKRLGDVLPQVLDGDGFDHPFLLKNDQAAVLTGKNGRTVSMTTDAPTVVVYTGNHFDGTGVAHNIKRHQGVTLETQAAPPSGPDWSAITLMPGAPYTMTTTWTFK